MIELHAILNPHGLDFGSEQIGEMRIINDLSNERRPEYGNYRIEWWGHNGGEKFEKKIKVKNHKRTDGFWLLVARALVPESMDMYADQVRGLEDEKDALYRIISKQEQALQVVRDKCKPGVDMPPDFGPLDVVSYVEKVLNDTKKSMENIDA